MSKFFGKAAAAFSAAVLFCGVASASTTGSEISSLTTSGTFATGTPEAEAAEALTTASTEVLNSAEVKVLVALPAATKKKAFQAMGATADAAVGSAAGIGGGVKAGGAKVSARVATKTAAMRSERNQPFGAAGPAGSTGWDVWASGLYTHFDQDGFDGKNGYDGSGYGMIMGVDKVMGNFLVGANMSYIDTDVDVKKVNYDSDIDTWGFGLYGSYNTDKWYVEVGGGYATSDIDSKRVITGVATAKSDTDADTWSTFIGAGYNIAVTDVLTITPNASASYIYTDTDGYTETGAGGLNQIIDDVDTDALVYTIGARASYALTDRLSLEGRASLSHDSIAEYTKVKSKFKGGTWAESKGLHTDSNSYSFGAGLNGQINDALSMSFNYDYETKKKFDGHTFMAGVRYEF